MYCRNCGKDVNEKAKACPACGVSPSLGGHFCHNCGLPTQINQVLCVKCGTNLPSTAFTAYAGRGDQTGLEVQLSWINVILHSPMSIPTVEIDGAEHRKYWGTHFFPTAPGTHTLRVYYRFLVLPLGNATSINVPVAEGNVVRVKYSTRLGIGGRGSLTIVQ